MRASIDFQFCVLCTLIVASLAVPVISPKARFPSNADQSLPNGTSWIDCDENETRILHFTAVTSEPSVVHTGEKQVVTKFGVAAADVPALTVTYRQLYHLPLLDRWVEFIHISVDLCRERSGLCPIRAGPFSTAEQHPPVNPLSPHGLYRSLQTFHDPRGTLLGCVRIDVPYVP
mmetsp:Transcript_59259/g.123770  ORF Transcript_59259/g.123770 Transcript_59259/m.123770 type:complete len:174 (+) Transcript_59259:94-615(+)